ncbi:hypothetical protein MKW92_031424, partial [Papaver armeniacum]
MIDAPNLMSIRINDGISQHLVVERFTSLVYAYICHMYTNPGVPIDVILKFVKKLSNVKRLKLSADLFE